MIHLVHVRGVQGATDWLWRRHAEIAANPVPVLVVGVTQGHAVLQGIFARACVGEAYFIDATGASETDVEVAPNVLLLRGREALQDAQEFIARSRRARQRVDILLVEDVRKPDLAWCGQAIDYVELAA